MRCRLVLLVVIALTSCFAAGLPAQSQDDQEETLANPMEWTRDQIENPPQRDLKVKQEKEPLPRTASGFPSPKRKSFAAVIRIKRPAVGWGRIRSSQESVTRLQVLDGMFLLEPEIGSRELESKQSSISFFLKQMPKEQEPSNEDLKFLTSEEVNEAVLDRFGKRTEFRQITVFADTEPEAQRRALSLIHVLDWGMFRPLQLNLFDELETLQAEQQKLLVSKESAEPKIEDIQKQLPDYADFTADMLTSLRLRQMELDVDSVGLKARITATERSIDKVRKTNPDLIRQLEESRITTEIELITLEARRSKTEEFLSQVKKKIELSDQLTATQAKLQSATTRLQQLNAQVTGVKENLARFQPPQIVDDEILIYPES